MEAPEKIYLHPMAEGGFGVLGYRLGNKDVEYVRKDTLVCEETIAEHTLNLLASQNMIRLSKICPRCKQAYLISGLKCLHCDYDGY